MEVRDVTLDNCAVVIGSEGRGISDTMLQKSERTIKIPMREDARSLNLANSVAVITYEALRQLDFPHLSGEGEMKGDLA